MNIWWPIGVTLIAFTWAMLQPVDHPLNALARAVYLGAAALVSMCAWFSWAIFQ